MSKLGTYFVQFRSMRNDLTGLPAWARVIFIAITLPGIALVALSVVALAVSFIALLVIAIPVYMLLRVMTRRGSSGETTIVQTTAWPQESRHVDAQVRDPGDQAPDEVNGE